MGVGEKSVATSGTLVATTKDGNIPEVESGVGAWYEATTFEAEAAGTQIKQGHPR
jgi:hypothetical protein